METNKVVRRALRQRWWHCTWWWLRPWRWKSETHHYVTSYRGFHTPFGFTPHLITEVMCTCGKTFWALPGLPPIEP